MPKVERKSNVRYFNYSISAREGEGAIVPYLGKDDKGKPKYGEEFRAFAGKLVAVNLRSKEGKKNKMNYFLDFVFYQDNQVETISMGINNFSKGLLNTLAGAGDEGKSFTDNVFYFETYLTGNTDEERAESWPRLAAYMPPSLDELDREAHKIGWAIEYSEMAAISEDIAELKKFIDSRINSRLPGEEVYKSNTDTVKTSIPADASKEEDSVANELEVEASSPVKVKEEDVDTEEYNDELVDDLPF